MGIGPGSLDIGGEKVLGIEIPKIPIAGFIKKALGAPPGEVIKQEAASAVQAGVVKPILIGAGIIGLAILVTAFIKGK